MQPHQQRVVDEKLDLDLKLERLNKFLLGPVFKTLLAYDRAMLEEQADLMARYSAVLGHRIAAFRMTGLNEPVAAGSPAAASERGQ